LPAVITCHGVDDDDGDVETDAEREPATVAVGDAPTVCVRVALVEGVPAPRPGEGDTEPVTERVGARDADVVADGLGDLPPEAVGAERGEVDGACDVELLGGGEADSR